MEKRRLDLIQFSDHKKRCKSIFDAIQSGTKIYVRMDQKIEREELNVNQNEADDERYIHFSVLTEESIDYDFEFFHSNFKVYPNEYRPYFIQFTAMINDRTHLFDTLENYEQWQAARFISSTKSVILENEHGIDGILEMSASPVVIIKGRLLLFQNKAIKQDTLDKINTIYNTSTHRYNDNKVIEKVLNNCWNNDYLQTIDIYNVGHGNCDYLRGLHNRILYDVGYNYRCYPNANPHKSKYWKAVAAIRHFKPNCVILSHWDLDHFIGCAYADQSLFNVPWIAPELVSKYNEKASINSIRLANYLSVFGNLYLVKRKQSKQLIATIKTDHKLRIKMWLGNGKSMCSAKNREGLYVEIIGSVRMLLCGDVPYNCINRFENKKVNILHVPHHCSKMELKKLNDARWKGEYAIISTNRSNRGKLCVDKSHHDLVKKKFKKVIHTIDNSSNNDEKNLSIQINYKKQKCFFR